jgi:hypothetical protein
MGLGHERFDDHPKVWASELPQRSQPSWILTALGLAYGVGKLGRSWLE